MSHHRQPVGEAEAMMSIGRGRGTLAGIAVLTLVVGLTTAPVASAADSSQPRLLLAKKVRPGSVQIRVSGDLLGSRATVRLLGVGGQAKGRWKSVRVRKRASVNNLKPGVYKIVARTIRSGGDTARPSVRPTRVKLTSKRGARVKVAYRTVPGSPLPPAMPTPTTSPTVPAPAVPPTTSPTSPPPVQPPVQPGRRITRASTSRDGSQADGPSGDGVWSPDGKRILFTSLASNLVPGDTNNARDVFVKTLATGEIVRVTSDKDGNQSDDYSSGQFGEVWSPDGTRVMFSSVATDLVPGDTNNMQDVFVKTLATGEITRVSVDRDGKQANGHTSNARFSPDGASVSFNSSASNLVPGDTNKSQDVLVKTLATGEITRVSVDRDGKQVDEGGYGPGGFSPDGSKVFFGSSSTQLVPGGTRGLYVKTLATGEVVQANTDATGKAVSRYASGYEEWSPDGSSILFVLTQNDLVVKNLITGELTKVNARQDGTLGFGSYFASVWSPDSAQVAFVSEAWNLVPEDTNNVEDLFVKTLATGAVTRVSTGSGNEQGNGYVDSPAWSPDGARILFGSWSTNLVSGSTNNAKHLFVKTLATGEVARISESSDGSPGDGDTSGGTWSPDGKSILFESSARNLVPGDTNNAADLFVTSAS